MRIVLGLALGLAAAAVLIPAALAGDNPAKTANVYCKQNKAALVGVGKPYRNHGQCLKAQKALATTEAKNAAKACKAEMADPGFAASHEGKSFQEAYGGNGANGNGKSQGKGKGNAFGKCVSGKAKEGKADGQQAEMNAAKRCKSWRAGDDVARAALGGKTFAETFGTAKNAYGKCVSSQAKAAEHGDDDENDDEDDD